METTLDGASAQVRKPLYEKYRPTTFSEVIGQSAVLKRLVTERKQRGTLGGQAYFLYGRSGTGKTTIGRLIATEVAGNDLGIDERVPRQATDEWFDQIERERYNRRPLGCDGWALILNEVHRLNPAQIERLLSALEPPGGLPSWVCWVLTTTVDGNDKLFDKQMDASPLASRTVELSLSMRGWARPMAEWLHNIATIENLNGQPLERYIRLVNDRQGNVRACLQDIGSGLMLKGGDE